MNYDDARPLIKTGDIIGVRGRKGPLAWLTRIVTRSPYTHVGVVVWLGGRVLMAEINGGGTHYVPLSQLAHTGFDVARPGCDPTRVESAIEVSLQDHQGYGFGTLGLIALRRVVGIDLTPADYSQVCSSYAVAILQLAGWAPKLPLIPAPDEVMAAAPLVLEIRP